MPLFSGDRAKVFDTFVSIEENKELLIIWRDVDLSNSERNALEILLSRTGYLGRAESWVEAMVISDQDIKANSFPLVEGQSLQEGFERIRTLACIPTEDYLKWRTATHSSHSECRLAEIEAATKKKGKNVDKVKLTKKDLEGIEKNLPVDLFHALHADTGFLKSAGWSQPPGSIWVTYVRPRDTFNVMPRARASDPGRKIRLPTVARFAVASQAPPRLTEAVSFAERVHLALVSRSDGSKVFTGCDESKRPLTGHKHSFVFCESNLGLGKGRRGEITHVVVHAPMGFERKERRALDSLTAVWGHGSHDIQLILLGVGQPEDFAGFDESKGESPMLAKSDIWISRTPFVSTRHPKATKTGVPKLDDNGLQIGSAEHELRRLLKLNNFPAPISVEPVPSTDLAGHETRWLTFRRERNHGNGRREASGYGYGFRIKFPEKVQGPIALGYGAHFGLGLFVPQSP
jgi:CRISPR-associated protein Csb2